MKYLKITLIILSVTLFTACRAEKKKNNNNHKKQTTTLSHKH